MDDGRFSWRMLVDDQEAVARQLVQLPSHPAIDARSLNQGRPPRLEVIDDQLFVIAWDLVPDAEDDYPAEVVLLAGDDWLLSVQWSSDDPPRALRELVDRPGDLQPGTPLRAAHRILSAIVVDYEKVVTDIEQELDAVEDEVFDPDVTENYERIYRLRRRIGHVDRAASALMRGFEVDAAALERLLDREPLLRPHFHHLRSDLTALTDLISTQRLTLDAVVSSHESNVSSRQNRDMRTIAAVAALLALPAMIAGVYGMNFKDMPLLHEPLGWIWVLLGAVVLDVWAVILFRRRGWLGENGSHDH